MIVKYQLEAGYHDHIVLICPICSMYGIFSYIWVIYEVNVGKYSIHGAYGCYVSFDIDIFLHIHLKKLTLKNAVFIKNNYTFIDLHVGSATTKKTCPDRPTPWFSNHQAPVRPAMAQCRWCCHGSWAWHRSIQRFHWAWSHWFRASERVEHWASKNLRKRRIFWRAINQPFRIGHRFCMVIIYGDFIW